MGILNKDGIQWSCKDTVWTIKYLSKFFDGHDHDKDIPRSEKYLYQAKSNHGETQEIVSSYPPDCYVCEHENDLIELLKQKLK